MDREYVLKHNNNSVVEFNLTEDFRFSKMGKIFDCERLPIGNKITDRETQSALLYEWIRNRGLPNSRSDLKKITENKKAENSIQLCFGSYGLNLSDHYWVIKKGMNIKWEDVNFFDNLFKGMLDKEIFNNDYSKSEYIICPDFTVGGNLRKHWKISGDKRLLFKEGRGGQNQEPFNEVIAHKIMQSLGIEHVKYRLTRKANGLPMSVCECMVKGNEELIDGMYITNQDGYEGNNPYERLMNVCLKNGIGKVRENIDNMILIDYIIGNIDRHLGNFGIIRNSQTLEWLRFAPIFDCGNSLFFNKENVEYKKNLDSVCRWFRESNEEKLKFVDFPQWYDRFKLNNLSNIVYTGLRNNDKINENKRKDVSAIVTKRINFVNNILANKT